MSIAPHAGFGAPHIHTYLHARCETIFWPPYILTPGSKYCGGQNIVSHRLTRFDIFLKQIIYNSEENCASHIEAEIKWTPFYRQHFQMNENIDILIKISLKFVSKEPINTILALVQIMAWRRSGDKPLSEPVIVYQRTYASLSLNELNPLALLTVLLSSGHCGICQALTMHRSLDAMTVTWRHCNALRSQRGGCCWPDSYLMPI